MKKHRQHYGKFFILLIYVNVHAMELSKSTYYEKSLQEIVAQNKDLENQIQHYKYYTSSLFAIITLFKTPSCQDITNIKHCIQSFENHCYAIDTKIKEEKEMLKKNASKLQNAPTDSTTLLNAPFQFLSWLNVPDNHPIIEKRKKIKALQDVQLQLKEYKYHLQRFYPQIVDKKD